MGYMIARCEGIAREPRSFGKGWVFLLTVDRGRSIYVYTENPVDLYDGDRVVVEGHIDVVRHGRRSAFYRILALSITDMKGRQLLKPGEVRDGSNEKHTHATLQCATVHC